MSRHFTLALVATAALLTSQAALAVTNDIQANFGVVSLPVSHGFSNTFASLGGGNYQDLTGHTISNATALTVAGTTYNFYDDFLFTLPGASNGSLTATAVSVTFGGLFGINDLQARLYAATPSTLTTGPAGPSLVSGWSLPTSVGGSTVTVSTFAAPVNLLAGTSYTLEIRGNVVGATGSYGGALNIAAAPVPEAESWAMTLAGLGVLGTLVRRRRAVR